MPCFLALLALIVPRVVVVALWFLSDWFVGVFDSILWPVIGFIFAPVTLLWYSVVMNYYGGVWGAWQIIGLVIALVIDLSPAKGKR